MGEKQEKELTSTKSLRKRRSFLETDYTSQVSFPAAAPGSPQRCCSWLPAQPSAEDTAKDTEVATAPVATQGQKDTAGTEPCSDLMDTETKTVMQQLLPSLSDVPHAGDHRGEEDSSPQTQHPPVQPLPTGQRRAAQESSAVETDPGCPSEESRAPSGGCPAQGAQEEGAELVATQHKASVVPSAVACPSDELLLPPAPVPSMVREGLLEPSLAACPESRGAQSCVRDKGSAGGEGHPDGQCCGHSSSQELSQASSPQVLSGETLRKVHQGHTGFPDTAQLLADCSSAPGVLTRLSWLSFGVRTDPVPPSLLQDPPEPLACLTTSTCVGASAVRRKIPTSPVGAGFGQELASSSGLGQGAEPTGAAGNEAEQEPQPAEASPPGEQAAGLGKGSAGISSSPVPLGQGAGACGAAKHSLQCFNPEEGEQSPAAPLPAAALGCSPSPRGLERCGCRLPYISCFPQPQSHGESEASVPQLPGPLTTPPASSCSLPRTPGSSFPVSIAGDVAGQDPHIRVLGQLKDQAWMSPADFSRFLAYTVELQEVVGKLCGSQATHLHDQCADQGAESKGALGWASQDLLSSCQALLSTEQPLTEVQRALRATFDRLVHLAVTCFQVTHCWQCRQRQRELGAALEDVVGTYQQLVQALHQQLHGQVCPELGTKLLARQHTALAAAILCLLQRFRAAPWL